jgi:hypothetical protein
MTHRPSPDSPSNKTMKRNTTSLISKALLVTTIGATLAGLALTGCGGGGGSSTPFTLLYAVTDTGRVLMMSDVAPNSAAFQWSIVDSANNPLPVQGIDYNSSTNLLYATGQVGAFKTIWRVNTNNGLGTFVTNGGIGSAGPVGVSYDPSNNKVAIVEHPNVNLDCGAVAGTLASSGPAFTGTGISEIAHTGQQTGAATTTCFAVDLAVASGALSTIGTNGSVRPAYSSGVVTAVGPLNIPNLADARGGFDIGGPSNRAFLAVNLIGGNAVLYTVDLATGAAQRLGPIGGLTAGEKIVGLCVVE